jgi:hypothetical protein
MQKEIRVKLDGDPSGRMETAAIKLPFDTRDVWGKARVPVKVTINGYMWRSTVANMDGCQFVVVNAEARHRAGVRAGDVVNVRLELDSKKRDVHVPAELKKALGTKLAEKLDELAFTHKKEFVQWYTGAKKEETRTRRIEKMKRMLISGKVI